MAANVPGQGHEPADTLLDLVPALLASGLLEALGELGQPSLEGDPDPLGHGLFLGPPLRGLAAQVDIPGFGVGVALDMDFRVTGIANGLGLGKIDFPGPLAADHQVSVALLRQPLDIVLGGDTSAKM